MLVEGVHYATLPKDGYGNVLYYVLYGISAVHILPAVAHADVFVLQVVYITTNAAILCMFYGA